MPGGGWNRKQIDEDAVIAGYLSGKGACELAKHLGVSVKVIYNRLESNGIKKRSNSEAHIGRQAGEENANWKGGVQLSRGYVTVRDGGKYVRQHRKVAAAALGRPLTPHEIVHHKNEDKSDNDDCNLQVLTSQAEHARLHMTPARAREMAQIGNRKRRLKAEAAFAALEGK